MKTFVVENNLNEKGYPESWFFLPDSAITNPGKPFFIPEMADVIEARCLVALKIGRLGKTIAPRFAHRYFDEFAFGVHFSAPLLKDSLLSKGLSPDRARAFDRSLFLSDFFPLKGDGSDNTVSFLKNGKTICSLNIDFSDENLGPVFAAVSAENTLKMGDIIIPSISDGVTVVPGDIIELVNNNSPILRIEIR